MKDFGLLIEFVGRVYYVKSLLGKLFANQFPFPNVEMIASLLKFGAKRADYSICQRLIKSGLCQIKIRNTVKTIVGRAY
nr:hypothetical protein [uncultured Pseudodesulfovibrio sp.]